MLVFGIIDFGYMINRDTMINNVSRDAVRVGSLNGTYADITGTATSELAQYGIPVAKTVITVTCTKDSGGSCTPYDAQATSGDSVTVKIVYTHSWITPTMSTLLGSTVTLTKQTTMRIE
jgi:Flp pilus assembly protein TadG